MPPNIVEVTRLLIAAVKRWSPDTAEAQLDYTLGLVATGLIPRQSHAQIPLMDLLIDEGAKPEGGVSALGNGNIDASRHLIKRGEKLTLPIATGLRQKEAIKRLLPSATDDEKLTALTIAAFYGNEGMVSLLLDMGVTPDGYPGKDSGFHKHATPLHHAVSSGSLNSVKLLVAAGSNLDAKDKLFEGTPYDWALYLQREDEDAVKKRFDLIADYLKSCKTTG